MQLVARIRECAATDIAVVEAALLIEAGWVRSLVDEVCMRAKDKHTVCKRSQNAHTHTHTHKAMLY